MSRLQTMSRNELCITRIEIGDSWRNKLHKERAEILHFVERWNQSIMRSAKFNPFNDEDFCYIFWQVIEPGRRLLAHELCLQILFFPTFLLWLTAASNYNLWLDFWPDIWLRISDFWSPTYGHTDLRPLNWLFTGSLTWNSRLVISNSTSYSSFDLLPLISDLWFLTSDLRLRWPVISDLTSSLTFDLWPLTEGRWPATSHPTSDLTFDPTSNSTFDLWPLIFNFWPTVASVFNPLLNLWSVTSDLRPSTKLCFLLIICSSILFSSCLELVTVVEISIPLRNFKVLIVISSGQQIWVLLLRKLDFGDM